MCCLWVLAVACCLTSVPLVRRARELCVSKQLLYLQRPVGDWIHAWYGVNDCFTPVALSLSRCSALPYAAAAGQGDFELGDGSVYSGDFRHGEITGRGKRTWPSGAWYEGEWQEGEMHGEGKKAGATLENRHKTEQGTFQLPEM